MIVIFGVSDKVKELDQEYHDCPKCGHVAHAVFSRRRWFTLFFIPLIPLGAREQYRRCNMCGLQQKQNDLAAT